MARWYAQPSPEGASAHAGGEDHELGPAAVGGQAIGERVVEQSVHPSGLTCAQRRGQAAGQANGIQLWDDTVIFGHGHSLTQP